MKNKKAIKMVEISIDEIKDIEKSHERLERELSNLKYYLYNVNGGDKNITFSKKVLAEIERILKSEMGKTRKTLKNAVAKNEDEERFLRMSKINSPDKKSIERRGKSLNVRSSIVASAIKTSELKKKGSQKNGVRN